MYALLRYFVRLKRGKIVLWCYLIWYLVIVTYHFDPQPKIWLNALGISVIIGLGLNLSVARNGTTDHWQTARLFIIPFCVSSFSVLIKDRGFVVILPPHPTERWVAILLCLAFVAATYTLKRIYRAGFKDA